MRDKYIRRAILIRTEEDRNRFIRAVQLAPLDEDKPIQGVLQEESKDRTPAQNSFMWAGVLKDIEEQVFVQGRTYEANVWHEQFKHTFLPEDDDPDILDLVKKCTYAKWKILPNGNRILVGSTTDLTVIGFCMYLEKIHAWGANRGVLFSEKSRDELLDVRTMARLERERLEKKKQKEQQQAPTT